MESKLLSIEELSEYLGISKSTIKRMIGRDFPVPIHITTRRIAFIRDEVDKWIKTRKRVDIN
tara:strand:+ start:321 stop:506 length:186 start_codon:yes stop_codon:yes gene_type:complete